MAFTAFFCCLPHPTYSVLEKRDLTLFPTFTWETLASGRYTSEISRWFSDSEPERDVFLTMSMKLKDMMRMDFMGDAVTIHASSNVTPDVKRKKQTEEEMEAEERAVGEYHNKVTANETASVARCGIIVVGKGKEIRALMAYGGEPEGGVPYAKVCNRYKEEFPDVNVYCMVIPTAVDFYCPEKARDASKKEGPTIKNIYEHLDSCVKAVDIYTTLGKHAADPIYLRTDHHWAPLAAYYAAQRLCAVAKVPFKPLTAYNKKVIHGFVGSMYAYSKDIALKENPEDFVYYVPKNARYVTQYIDYTIDRNYKVIGERKACKGDFFIKYPDGSPGAYCTFMGGDTHITQIGTNVHNGRRLLILKDSFGNAIPGYLLYSFSQIHIVDYRYFTKNMRNYVRGYKITDILFANNIFGAYSPSICQTYIKFLDQSDTFKANNKDNNDKQ